MRHKILFALLALALVGCTHSMRAVTPGPGAIAPQVFQGHGGNTWVYFQTGSSVNDGMIHWHGAGMTLISRPFNVLLEITATGKVVSHPLQGPSQRHFDTVGPDGNLWMTDHDSSDIQMVTRSYHTTVYPIRSAASPSVIAAGSDGALWFSVTGSSTIVGRLTTKGQYSEFALAPGYPIRSIASGPDGNLWATVAVKNTIYRITTQGTATPFNVPGGAIEIISGPDGALWYSGTVPTCAAYLGRLAVDGTVTSYPIAGCSAIERLALGPDGKIWMSVNTDGPPRADYIISFDPVSHQFSTPVPRDPQTSSIDGGMAMGADGNIWMAGLNNLVAVYLRQSLSAKPSPVTIDAPGRTADLTVTETNYGGNWSGSSSNNLVATVKRSGTRGILTVTAVGVGTCILTIGDSMYNIVKVKVTVL